jgi:hypothetical protein
VNDLIREFAESLKEVNLVDKILLQGVQLDYLQEIVPEDWDKISPVGQEYLINMIDQRIMEITGSDIPKGLDADKQIKEVLSPILSELKPELLEAPYDSIQSEKISDYILSQESLDYENWKELPFNEKMDVLSSLEKQIAQIEHRPECPVYAENLREHGCFIPEEYIMVIKKMEIDSVIKTDYYKVLNTLIHEGRHAYQNYNIHVREVHPQQNEINSWRENNKNYLTVEENGWSAYRYQPVEKDAFSFANDIIENIKYEKGAQS